MLPEQSKRHSVKRLICLILGIMLITAGIGCFGAAFARFRSSVSGTSPISIAKWKIAFKDGDKPLENMFKVDFKVSDKADIVNGKFAPGKVAEAEFILDLTGTDVAVDYMLVVDTYNPLLGAGENLKLDITQTNNHSGVTNINLNGNNFIPLNDNKAFESSNGIFTFKFTLTWDAESSANIDINDALDAAFVLRNNVMSIPMSIKISQHIIDIPVEESKMRVALTSDETLSLVKNRVTQGANFRVDEQDLLSENPERGFYSVSEVKIDSVGNLTSERSVYDISNTSKLLFLKVDLSDFSGNMNDSKTDMLLTQSAIEALDVLLGKIKENDNTIILRFVYDGLAKISIEGKIFEPAQDMIIKHIKQFAGSNENNAGTTNIFKKYSKTINAIQIGFYGLWGECNTNTSLTDSMEKKKSYLSGTISALLEATEDTDITIAVRKPEYYTYYRNIAIANIAGDTTTSNEAAYRVGLFNDAIGADGNDMGTYSDVTKEKEWLYKQTSHAFMGGEAIPDKVNNDENEYNFNLFPDYAYKVHLTYLNWEWNQILHKIWSEKNYPGDNELYKNKKMLTFIENNLGYRFVIKQVRTYATAQPNDSLPIEITVNNVGFSNLIKRKRADIILVNKVTGDKISFETVNNIVARGFISGTSVTQTTKLQLPPNIAAGQYKIYLRLSSGDTLANGKYYSAIRFANEGLYDENLQASYLGEFTVVEAAA